MNIREAIASCKFGKTLPQDFYIHVSCFSALARESRAAIHGQCPHGTLAPQVGNHPANPYREQWKENFSDKGSPCEEV